MAKYVFHHDLQEIALVLDPVRIERLSNIYRVLTSKGLRRVFRAHHEIYDDPNKALSCQANYHYDNIEPVRVEIEMDQK